MTQSNQNSTKRKLPKPTKILISIIVFSLRIISSPAVFLILSLSYFSIIIIRTLLYIFYGGEFISYKDTHTVDNILELIKSQMKENLDSPISDSPISDSPISDSPISDSPISDSPTSPVTSPVTSPTSPQKFIPKKYDDGIKNYINGVYQQWRYNSDNLKYCFQDSNTVMDVDSGFEYFIFYNFFDEIKEKQTSDEFVPYIESLLKNKMLIEAFYDLSDSEQEDYILRSFPTNKSTISNYLFEENLLKTNFYHLTNDQKSSVLYNLQSLSLNEKFEWALSQNLIEPYKDEKLKGYIFWFFKHHYHSFFRELENSNLQGFLSVMIPQQMNFWISVQPNIKFSYSEQELKSIEKISTKYVSKITEENTIALKNMSVNPKTVLETKPSEFIKLDSPELKNLQNPK